MSKFKRGDRVKCTNAPFYCEITTGGEYEVWEVSSCGTMRLKGCSNYWNTDRFELVADIGPQSAAPSSVARVEAQARDATAQLHQFESGAVRGTDASGTRYDLISPHMLQAPAETYAEGSAKYGDDNWLKGIPSKDLMNHAMRHLVLWQLGDTSEPHLAHAIWNLGAIIHFEKTRPELVVRQYAEGGKA